jgi:hypothetical protein
VKLPALVVLSTALFAFAVFPSAGQGTISAGLRCVVFTVKDVSPAGTNRDYEQAITASVRAAFASRGYPLIAESSWREAAAARSLDEDALRQSSVAIQLAKELGADLAVTGFYSVQQEEITYSMQCWEVATGRLASNAEQTTPFNLAFFSALSLKLIDDLLPALRPASGEPRVPVVFTSPDEGMEVLLSGDLSIGKITNGRASWGIDSGSAGQKVLVEKRKDGYHSASQVVTLTPGKEIALSPLRPEHGFALELDWTLGQLLGAGVSARTYVVPDWLFIAEGNYFFVQPPVTAAARAVIHDDISVGVGGYLLLSPESPVRLGVSTGVGLLVTFLTVPGFPTYSDVYVNVANVWIEARLGTAVIFLRQEYKYSLGYGMNLLGQGWLINRFPPTTLGVLFQ